MTASKPYATNRTMSHMRGSLCNICMFGKTRSVPHDGSFLLSFMTNWLQAFCSMENTAFPLRVTFPRAKTEMPLNSPLLAIFTISSFTFDRWLSSNRLEVCMMPICTDVA
eukprot:CAMPEP_0172556480 /NCGR_PEP_ID=MMETSP1067-20121228/66557_1 /TAXON_ID=265564 ORGANISM="Thalassiosira punctigera, Strain Tpunct2005C2" /NCGR_SAMPLE_ID=MMETSP1067 /ASSEMBLY_ACC=CAM_ASM_000444 /LENGTH=109 /DNA_ID=CAMNT_0013345301 /DNA_START=139 /DNA_END=464 /DNA_ORIENTATION=+